MQQMTKLCFIDTETTGLDRKRRRIWDFACIVREPDSDGGVDVEHQFFIDVSLKNADPFALNIGHFWERFPGWQARGQEGATEARRNGTLVSPWDAAKRIAQLTAGAVLIGAVPSFDEESFAALLRKTGLVGRYDYHLVDVETFAAGYLGLEPPWKNDVINKAAGIQIPEEDRHTALGDARGVRDLYDKIVGSWVH
jgi:DNA polymerase III epsilon subunit-like protein